MRAEQLRDHCERQKAKGLRRITLVLDREPSTDRMRLTPRRGPVGEVLCCPASGGTAVLFEVGAVLRFLDKVEAEGRGRP